MSVSIQPTQSSDLISLNSNATLSDRQIEMLDWCRSMSSEVWAGYIDGELVCLWGLIPPSLISTQAYLWMHSNERVNEHKFLFVRHSQRMVEQMLKRYDVIVGHCVVGARNSIRWVRWLGGVFDEPNGSFMPFRIEGRA